MNPQTPDELGYFPGEVFLLLAVLGVVALFAIFNAWRIDRDAARIEETLVKLHELRQQKLAEIARNNANLDANMERLNHNRRRIVLRRSTMVDETLDLQRGLAERMADSFFAPNSLN